MLRNVNRAASTLSGPWAPIHRIVATAALAVLTAGAALTLAVETRWLGLDLQAQADDFAPALVTGSRGPSAAIPPGTVLARIAGTDSRLDLRGLDLAPEPDTRFPGYAEYRAFLRRQSALSAILDEESVRLESVDGRQWTVTPASERPLADVPLTFWLQLGVGVAGLLAGAGVWAFRRSDAAAGYVALTGLGLLISASSAAVYSARELALPSGLFRALHLANGGGALLFCAAFAATLWHYPTRLARAPVSAALLLIYAIVFVAGALAPAPDFGIVLRMPVLVGFALTAAFAALQWRRTRQRPLERAALQWFLLSWLGGGGSFLLIVFVPSLLGVDTGPLQAYAFALFLVIYAGLVLGVLRYRLFGLGRWWLAAWSLMLGSLIFVGLDLGLVHLLKWRDQTALLVALVAVSWLYLPLRSWLWLRWFKPDHRDLETLLSNAVAADTTEPAHLWRESMRRLFAPLQIEPLRPAPSAAMIAADGSALLVPGVGGSDGLRLDHAQQGRRLFTSADIRTVHTIRAVIDRLVAYREAVSVGIQRERERVTRELHDDVGSRLLELLHQTDGPTRIRVRDALDELRLVLHSLASHGQRLEDVLGWCRGDFHERADNASIGVSWAAPEQAPAAALDPHLALLLVRALRSLVAMAIPRQRIDVIVDFADDRLRVDALLVPLPADDPQTLLPLATLNQRAQLLGASMDTSLADRQLRVRLDLPLLRRAEGPAAPPL